MREYLFKAQRIDTKEWVEGYLTKRPSAIQVGNDYSPWYISVPPVDPDDNGGYYNVYPGTVRAFIGKRDRNGGNVYEGDVCRFYGDDGECSDYVVLWDENEAGYKLWEVGTDVMPDVPDNYFFENCELTGLYVACLGGRGDGE